jgi:transaldolase
VEFFVDSANLDELRTGVSWGRLDDIGFTGMDPMRGITQTGRNYGYATQVRAAPLPFSHPLTDKGLEQFLKAWRNTFQEAPVVR